MNVAFLTRRHSSPCRDALGYILAALLTTLLLVALVVLWPRLGVPVVGLALVTLALFVAQRVSFPHLVAFAVFVTAALYRGLLYASQISIAGIVLNPLDLLWVYVVARFYLQYSSRSRIAIPGYLILAIALLTAIMGLVWGQPFYNIAKLMRTEMFLGFGIILVVALGSSERITVLKALVFGGLITALAQIMTFVTAVVAGINIWSYLGVSASESRAYRILDPSATSSYRDNGVVINFALLGLLILLSFAGNRFTLFKPPVSIVISAILILAIVLSMTRSNWIALALMVAIWSVISGMLSKRVFWISVMVVTIPGLIIVVLTQLSGVASLFDLLLGRLLEFGTGSDGNTLGDRAMETLSALQLVSRSPVLGVGAADVEFFYISPNGFVDHVVRNQLHNGFVQYLLSGGIVAITVVGGIFVTAIANSWIRAGKDRNDIGRSIDRSLFLMIVAIVVLTLTTGLINDFQQAVVSGVILGMAVSRAPDQTTSVANDNHMDRIWRQT